MSIICNPFFTTRKYPSADEKLRCFVIMPFVGDLIQDIYKNCTKPTIEKLGLECYRGDDIFSTTAVIEDIFGAICQADIIVGEFTGKNPNVLYEAGIAHTLGKPLIGITQDIDDIPFDLRSIRHIVYISTPTGFDKLKTDLGNTITTVLSQKSEMYPRQYVDNEEQINALLDHFRKERQRTATMYSLIEERILKKYEQYRLKIKELSILGHKNITLSETGIQFVKVDAMSVDVDYFDEEENEVKNIGKENISAFHISKSPITNLQYTLFMKDTGHPCPDYWESSKYVAGEELYPVMGVSWVDVTMFCKWLSEISGSKIDIPSEAQWLAAAGYDKSKQLYPWGNSWIANACNSNEFDQGKGHLTSIDRFDENISPYGCIDMLGNVWEWTKSSYDLNNNSGFRWRAVRGGANYTNLNGVGSLARLVAYPGHFLFVHDLGFRVIQY
jgi:hypothetical protein